MPLTAHLNGGREGRGRGKTRSASRETCQQVTTRADGVFRDRTGRFAPRWPHPIRRKGWTMPNATLHICITCRRAAEPGSEGPRPGAALYEAIAALPAPDGVRVLPTECLSACKTGCSVALSAPGKYAYVYGFMDPDLHAAAILEGAGLYAAAADGIVPWRARPEIFRKQSIARIPPMEAP